MSAAAPRRGKTVFLLSISSDIGKALGQRFARDGFRVVGTYRDPESVKDLRDVEGVTLIPCDVLDAGSVRIARDEAARTGVRWDVFISCVGTQEPIGPFFRCDFEEWERSVIVNSTAQLRVLHALHPLRSTEGTAQVVFFAGGGTNNPLPNYSAYCVSKIMLMKMCELLDDESSDLSIYIVGPGWVRTKIHEQTLRSPKGAGDHYRRVRTFVGSVAAGTSHDDIYDCVRWCMSQPKGAVSGRNFSVVHDPWRGGGSELLRALVDNKDRYKLRRYGNTGPTSAESSHGALGGSS